jgi:hypothetical protein
MHHRVRAVLAATVMGALSGCAFQSDHEVVYLAERGDYDAALRAANPPAAGILDAFSGAACRDYGTQVAVLVAQGSFAAAVSTCHDYLDSCAVVDEPSLCFSYDIDELERASADAAVAASLQEASRELIHYRWLSIRDDYQGAPLKRPIY